MSTVALIIAHPGHELRIYKFLQVYKPRVYLITDGSGGEQASRVQSTKEVLESCGATLAEGFDIVPDKKIYQELLHYKVKF